MNKRGSREKTVLAFVLAPPLNCSNEDTDDVEEMDFLPDEEEEESCWEEEVDSAPIEQSFIDRSSIE